MKGKPIADITKGTYVVEFWATWCGPCRASIPHLTELAKEHRDVSFIGVSVWEKSPVKDIQKFVSDMGAKMDYRVATDANDFMAKNWMTAAHQGGIPTAFLVKDGIIQWIGHPAELEKPLGDLLSGKLKIDDSVKAFNEKQSQMEQSSKYDKAIGPVIELIVGGKPDAALKEMDRLAKEMPETVQMVEMYRKVALVLVDPEKGKKMVDDLIQAKNFEEFGYNLIMFPKGNAVGLYFCEKALGAPCDKFFANYNVMLFAMSSGDKSMALKAYTATMKTSETDKSMDHEMIKQVLENMPAIRKEIDKLPDTQPQVKGSF